MACFAYDLSGRGTSTPRHMRFEAQEVLHLPACTARLQPQQGFNRGRVEEGEDACITHWLPVLSRDQYLSPPALHAPLSLLHAA